MSMRKPIENRELKNTVFVDLFQMCPEAKENALSLYNAINGTELTDPSVIEQIRLEDTIYKGIRNDVSFAVEDKIIVLMEHQSTINENMPLRFFMYLARLYEKIISTRLRYKKKLVKIPVPEMFVFYNGTEPLPPRTTLRLSDAFINNPEFNEIELTVTVINISASAEKTDDILEKCGIIKEYSKFVDIVRDFISKKTEQPYKEAIRYCIKNGILKGYLEREGTEVESMLIAEYDYDTDIAVQREESFEEGHAEGKAEGIAEGLSIGLAKGHAEGRAEGHFEGRAEGIDDLFIATKELKSGSSSDEIIKKYGADIANKAMQLI